MKVVWDCEPRKFPFLGLHWHQKLPPACDAECLLDVLPLGAFVVVAEVESAGDVPQASCLRHLHGRLVEQNEFEVDEEHEEHAERNAH